MYVKTEKGRVRVLQKTESFSIMIGREDESTVEALFHGFLSFLFFLFLPLPVLERERERERVRRWGLIYIHTHTRESV